MHEITITDDIYENRSQLIKDVLEVAESGFPICKYDKNYSCFNIQNNKNKCINCDILD